jgi:hypothetical protein
MDSWTSTGEDISLPVNGNSRNLRLGGWWNSSSFYVEMLTFEINGLRGFSRRSGEMMGWLTHCRGRIPIA